MPVWKPEAPVITQVRVKGTVSGPAVTFWHRPYAYGHRLTIWTRGEPPRELLELAKALNAHLRQGRMPRTCPAWLALYDWVVENLSASRMRDVRVFQEADATSGRSRIHHTRRRRRQ
jgi:hypothetical protein